MDRNELWDLACTAMCKAELAKKMSETLCCGMRYDYSISCKSPKRPEIEREILMRYAQNKLFAEVLKDIAETLLDAVMEMHEMIDMAQLGDKQDEEAIKVGNAA